MRLLIVLLLTPLALLVACSGPGVDTPSLIEQAEGQEKSSAKPSPAVVPSSSSAPESAPGSGYVKRAGLHIDIPFLADKRLDSLSKEQTLDQLGVLISRKELPENEEEVLFDKTQVWLYDGRIYRVRKKLAHPMDVPTALGTSGFPLDLGPPIEASAELRWNFSWNMRRIRLERTRDDERLYRAIDVYAFLPKELF